MDFGATVDLMEMPSCDLLKNKGISLQMSNIKIFAYGSDIPIKLKGQYQAQIESKDRLAVSQIYVAAFKGGNLLNAKTAQDLGLIQMVNTISNLPQTDNAKSSIGLFQ